MWPMRKKMPAFEETSKRDSLAGGSGRFRNETFPDLCTRRVYRLHLLCPALTWRLPWPAYSPARHENRERHTHDRLAPLEGPNADGVADGRSLPTQWSQTENVRWSVKLPGWGTSSPVVYGDRLFVTSQVEHGGKKSLLTLCFHRDTGKELWRRDFGLGIDQRVHEKSNLAVNTPAVTEDAVYVAFGNSD